MKNNKKIIALLLIFLVGVMYAVSLIIDDNNYVVTEAKEPEEILTNEIVKEDIVKVDIKGAVNKPGVYEVDESARVIDVIKIAGGLTKKANTEYINLAKSVENEMIIWVYTNDQIKDFIKQDIVYEYIEKDCNCPSVSTSACVGSNNSEKNELININKATKDELMTLTGLGESKALSIIEYRNRTPFTKIEDIKNVNGIGDSVFEKIKNYITV